MPGGVTRGKGPVLLAAWARRLAHTCPSLRIASSSTSVHTDFHSFFNDFHCFSTISTDFHRFLVSRSHPGVSGSFSEFREAPGPRLGAQRRKIRLFKTIDLGAICEDWWASTLLKGIYLPVQIHRSGRQNPFFV